MMIKKTIVLAAAAATLLTACQETLAERAAREAREMTETRCPLPVGEGLFLDSVSFDIATMTQTQYFRFTGASDHDSVIADAAYARTMLVEELKNTPSYKTLMQHGTQFRYIYYSTKEPGKVLFETLITPADY